MMAPSAHPASSSVRLPLDAAGWLVLQLFTVTSMVQQCHCWARCIPNMDGVVRAIVSSTRCCSRIDWRVVPCSSLTTRHGSSRQCRRFWAKTGNLALPGRAGVGASVGAVPHFKELADALMPCAIVWGHDSDRNYLVVLSGCSGELVWGWGVTGLRMVYPEDPVYEA
jgi:hypothetical protein